MSRAMNRRVLPTLAASIAMVRASCSEAFQLIWTVLGGRGRADAPSPPLLGCGGGDGVTDGRLAAWPRNASVSSSGIGLRLNPLMSALRNYRTPLSLGSYGGLGH